MRKSYPPSPPPSSPPSPPPSPAPSSPRSQDLAALGRLSGYKSVKRPPQPTIGVEVMAFFKKEVKAKYLKLGKIADVWVRLVPLSIQQHVSLEGISSGTLTVKLDSASHMFELKQLLMAGLEKQLIQECTGSGLRKITLKRGSIPTHRPHDPNPV